MSQKISHPLFCKIGKTVEFIREVMTDDNKKIEIGDKYVVVDLIGFGWDLEKLSGEGIFHLRLLNSEIKNYVKFCD